jgi:hypothetical protein
MPATASGEGTIRRSVGARLRGRDRDHHHAHRVPQQAAVARLVHRRGGDRAVEPHHPAALEPGLASAGQQRPLDLLPGRGADRADRLVQHRLLRAPGGRQPGERPERRRVLERKRQLLIAQLAVLLEHGAAQHRLRRQALPPGLLHAISAQVRRDQAGQLAVVVEPCGSPSAHGRSRARRRGRIYGLDRAFLAHCRLRWLGVVLWNQWLDAKVYPKPPGLPTQNPDFSHYLNDLRLRMSTRLARLIH